MRKAIYCTFAALSLSVMAGCGSQKKAEQISGLDLSNLDTTVAPGTDFFEFACGGWNKQHPLTGEYSRFGSFDMLAENNQNRVRELIEKVSKEKNEIGTPGQKIGDLYALAMDSVRLNKEGFTPVKQQYDAIAAMTSKNEILPTLIGLIQNGVGTYFNAYVYTDPKNSNQNIFQMSQGGFNLGEKEYYLDNDSITRNIRTKYIEYITRLFTLAGDAAEVARKKATDVMEVETTLAKAAKSAAELRDPEANYHKIKYTDFKAEFTGLDWDEYLRMIGLKGVDEINVQQPEALKAALKLINNQPLNKTIAYLQFHLLDTAAPVLSDDFGLARFDFYDRVMAGKTQQKPRWKRSVEAVNNMVGELVGQLYVKAYFPPEAKERMLNLVNNLKVALGERIDQQEWMSDSTKANAHAKLNTFHVKIGYPDKWKDYSKLQIDKKESYWTNVCKASRFDLEYNLSRLGKPVDKDEWLMTPQTVNAYYNPSTNEICFPAAILQYPFFDMNADDAFNYGAIGVVIGHEMTHGFDDEGRKYDKDGNLKEWWTKADAEGFQKRAQVMIDFFNQIEVLPGLHGNGQLTLGENLADHGGLKVSFLAFKNATKDSKLGVKDGFTPEQRFFIAYSTVWAGNIRDEEIRKRTKSDPHSLGRWRVNGALPQIDAWYEAFNIQPSDPMYIAPEKRVRVW